MKSFAMLATAPIEGFSPADPAQWRYFIDGTRVTQDEYRKLVDNCDRQDTFHSYQFAGRTHCRSVCYR